MPRNMTALPSVAQTIRFPDAARSGRPWERGMTRGAAISNPPCRLAGAQPDSACVFGRARLAEFTSDVRYVAVREIYGTFRLPSKDESPFYDCTRLISVRARAPESVARREIGCPDKREVAANEKALVLKGGRQRGRPGPAARTVEQIDGVLVGVPSARDVFRTSRQREAVFEGAAHPGGLRRASTRHRQRQSSGWSAHCCIENTAGLSTGPFV